MGLIITEEHVSKEGPARPGAAKSVGFVRRRTGMAVEAFQRHWREVHGPLGAAVPLLQRYVQSHTRPVGLRAGARTHLGRRCQPLVRRRGGASRRLRLRGVGAGDRRQPELHRRGPGPRRSSPPSTSSSLDPHRGPRNGSSSMGASNGPPKPPGAARDAPAQPWRPSLPRRAPKSCRASRHPVIVNFRLAENGRRERTQRRPR